jgi:hypothetical protein
VGILDDLRQEAEHIRHLQEAEDERRSAEELSDRAGLRDRMVRIHHYLFELVDHLDVVGWKVSANYAIPGASEIEFIQGNYRIYIDNVKDPKRISLRCDCTVPETRRYSVTPLAMAEEFRRVLRSEQVPFAEWPIYDGAEVEGTLFECRLRVLVSLLFEVVEQDSAVRLTIHNFEGLVDEKLNLHYRRIDNDWLDQLGHYLLRKDRRLSRLQMPDELRAQIRQRLEEDKRRRALDSAQPETSETSETRENMGLFRRLGSLLRGSTPK